MMIDDTIYTTGRGGIHPSLTMANAAGIGGGVCGRDPCAGVVYVCRGGFLCGVFS